ncbi:hypothetical protein [Niveispirillum irakense]|uniref:hypothetical protein n=1 Tax=Niveispirillum irakense TaxID=34011 RepID=UPI0012B59D0A|nr:hypothetical protein [Niveispirillum irakense]
MSVEGHYPPDALKADWLRAGAGLAVALGPFLFVWPHPLVAVPLLAMAALFLIFALRTAERQWLRVRADDAGLHLTSLRPRHIPWSCLQSVRLTYYSTKRDRSGGWMRLKVTGGGRSIALESQLAGFDAIAGKVAEAVIERGLILDTASQENFHHLGHYV